MNRHDLHAALPLALVPIALLGGCASTTQIADQGVKANMAVERAHNQILMLNVVRAYHRRPLHFTGFTGVNGSIGTGRPGLSLATPFGPDALSNIYTLTTTFTPDVPSFQTGIYDSQEFMRGLMTPVPAKLVHFYLDQGWPQELILHMFVREIELVDDKHEVKKRFLNYPPNDQVFSEFQEVVGELSKCNFEVDTVPEKTPYGPKIPVNNLRDAEKLALSKTADFAIEPVPVVGWPSPGHDAAEYRLSKVRQTIVFRFEPKEVGKVCDGIAFNETNPATRESKRTMVKSGALLTNEEKAARRGGKPVDEQAAKTAEKLTAVLTLRSPEAMIYYLGELAKVQNEPEFGPRNAATIGFGYPRPSKKQALFVVEKDPRASDTHVLEVDYEGSKYAIPKNGGRSMHVLSLVSQIIGLQKKAGDLPATTNVRVLP